LLPVSDSIQAFPEEPDDLMIPRALKTRPHPVDTKTHLVN